MSSYRPRLFTVSEANALLPELERLLNELQFQYRAARYKYVELKQLRAVGIGRNGELIMAHDFRSARQELDDLLEQVNRGIRHINELGCQLKHVEAGLVDFPTRVKGKPALLCWRLGEPMVHHYHGRFEGYRRRRPLEEI